MDLLNQLNRAMEYIEENITNGDILAGVSGATAYSPYHFGRIFYYIADMPLSEYIRKRRLSLAAMELQSGGEKVIDLAVKYGYDSADSFTRAFAKQHSVTPTAARKPGVMLQIFPPLTFQIKIEGVRAMNWRIEQREAFEVYGVEKIFPNEEFGNPAIVDFWEEELQNGRRLKFSEPHGLINYFDSGADTTPYMIFAFKEAGSDTAGFKTVTVPKHTWAVFRAEGMKNHDDCKVPELFGRAYSEWLPSSGYDKAKGPDMEIYGDGFEEVWIPVVKK